MTVELRDDGMIVARKRNFPNSGLPGAWIAHTFMPGPGDIGEYLRQAELWADEPETATFTYTYGPTRVRPKYR